MTILNLVNPDKSEISYKIIRFPDGQQDIILDDKFIFESGIYDTIEIHSRFNSFLDLELIIASNKALRRLLIKDIHLFIPYLLGARSDRKFTNGGTNYLVDVIAPIINSQDFNSVTVLDVHSAWVTDACIYNLKIKNNYNLVINFMKDKFSIDDSNMISILENFNRSSVVVSPDEGASKKIYPLLKDIRFKGDVVICSKLRETSTGKIINTYVPFKNPSYSDKDLVIIDDICDGGRTFIEIAKECKAKGHVGKMYLIVTHGIFSNGLKELSGYFDKIYTTNSVMDINTTTEFGMRNEKYLHKINQINIF